MHMLRLLLAAAASLVPLLLVAWGGTVGCFFAGTGVATAGLSPSADEPGAPARAAAGHEPDPSASAVRLSPAGIDGLALVE